MTIRKLVGGVACVVGGAVLVAGWHSFAPQKLGGRADYVVVVGSSMEPRLHRDDLVLVRRAPSYRVGDVVAYRSATLGRVVLHRIHARTGARYTFKGDANQWIDPDRPTERAFVGKLSHRLPGAGRYLVWLQAPQTAAFGVGLAALLAAGAGPRRRRRVADAWRRGVRIPSTAAVHAPTAFAVALTLALVFIALAVAAFARPAEQTVTEGVAYRQSGTFAYAGRARSGVYDRDRARTGDPLFLRLVDRADLRFEYRFLTAVPHSVRGRARLLAEIRGGDGWRRTLPLAPPRRFRGDRVRVSATLEPEALWRVAARAQARTGVGADAYVVAVVPDVRLRGRLGGAPIATSFRKPLLFQLDRRELRLQAGPNESARPRTAAASRGSARVSARRAATLSLLGAAVSVGRARWTFLGGALLFLGLALLARAAVRQADALGDDERIAARYGGAIVPVTGSAIADGRPSVRVETIEGLVRLADDRERTILHERRPGADVYFFEDGGLVYWHGAGDAASPVAAPPRARARTNGGRKTTRATAPK